MNPILLPRLGTVSKSVCYMGQLVLIILFLLVRWLCSIHFTSINEWTAALSKIMIISETLRTRMHKCQLGGNYSWPPAVSAMRPENQRWGFMTWIAAFYKGLITSIRLMCVTCGQVETESWRVNFIAESLWYGLMGREESERRQQRGRKWGLN